MHNVIRMPNKTLFTTCQRGKKRRRKKNRHPQEWYSNHIHHAAAWCEQNVGGGAGKLEPRLAHLDLAELKEVVEMQSPFNLFQFETHFNDTIIFSFFLLCSPSFSSALHRFIALTCVQWKMAFGREASASINAIYACMNTKRNRYHRQIEKVQWENIGRVNEVKFNSRTRRWESNAVNRQTANRV